MIVCGRKCVLKPRRSPHGHAARPVFPIYRDFPGILIVLIPFWSGMG